MGHGQPRIYHSEAERRAALRQSQATYRLRSVLIAL